MPETTGIQALLDRIRAGDSAAWDQLLATTYDEAGAVVQRVFRSDFASLGRHTHTTDILHEVDRRLLEAVHRGMKTPNDEAQYFGLVRRIARQVCLDSLAYFRLPFRRAEDLPAELPVATAGPPPEADTDIADAIERLTDEEFDLLVRLRRGQPAADLAAELRVSDGEVSRRRRALENRLVGLLGGENGGRLPLPVGRPDLSAPSPVPVSQPRLPQPEQPTAMTPPPLEELQAEWVRYQDEALAGRVDPTNEHAGQYAAFFGGKVVGYDPDPVALRERVAAELHVHPGRVVVNYLDP